MVFSVIYQTQTCINLGSIFTSSHTIMDGDKHTLSYSVLDNSTLYENLIFNEKTGDFTINGTSVGNIKFTIIIQNENGIGYKIPINIEVIDEKINNNYLQYNYQTGYSFSAALHLYPSFYPEYNDVIETNPFYYMLVGAPTGIIIDENTGQISGNPINYGQFLITVTVINKNTNTFVCSSSLQFIIYNSNILSEIIEISPNNEVIHSNKLPLTITCKYNGAAPSCAQSLSYKLSSPIFTSCSIVNYIASDTIKLTYLVSLTNFPGSFPIVLTDEISGFFITSLPEITFTSTAACFNEDTNVLIVNENNEQEYKNIKELKVGDNVVTYKHDVKTITHIGSQTMINNPDSVSDCMYKLTVRLSKDKITHDLILLGRHSLLVDKLTKRQTNKTLDIHPVDKIDDKELLITMFNDDFDQVEDKKEFTYYHLVLEKESDNIDRRYGIYVNGCTHPDNRKDGVIAATTYEKDFLKQFC